MDWDAEPDMAAATNQDDPWGAGDAAAVPLPADDDFGFGDDVAPKGKSNIVVTVTEIAVDTPAATPAFGDDDWAMADAPAPVSAATGGDGDDWGASGGFDAADALGDGAALFGRSDPFGGGTQAGDAFGGLAAEGDAFGASAAGNEFSGSAPEAAPKPKRVIRTDLIPENSKNFAEFFIPVLSAHYEEPEPEDETEVPLRRQESYNIFARQLANAAQAGAEKPQDDTEKKAKKKSHIHYNGNRITGKHTWTDFEVRCLVSLISRNAHKLGIIDPDDTTTKKARMGQRRHLNASLPPAKDGHTHKGQWAYHDLWNAILDECPGDMTVVDVRDMTHRLVDDRKGAITVVTRMPATRLTRTMAMAWRRKQKFTGTLQEWVGEDGKDGKEPKEGRKAALEKEAKEAEKLQFNTGAVKGVADTVALDIDGVARGWGETEVDAFDGGQADSFAAVAPDPFGAAAAPAAAGDDGDGWDDEAAPAPAVIAPTVAEGGEWNAEELAIVTQLMPAVQNMPSAQANAPTTVASQPRAAFDLEDPFSAPLPGASNADEHAPAAPFVVNALDKWGIGDDSAPSVVQSTTINSNTAAAPASNPFRNSDSASTVNATQNASASAALLESAIVVDTNALDAPAESNVAHAALDSWGDDDATPSAPSAAQNYGGSGIRGGDAEAFLNTIMEDVNMGNTAPRSYQSQGFTSVNAKTQDSGYTSQAPSAPTSAPQSYTVDPNTGVNPERIALLAAAASGREGTPPTPECDPQQLHLQGKAAGGVSGFNAIPLAFNRLTGQRAAPAAAPTSGGNGARTPLASASVNASGGGTTKIPGWDDSPKSKSAAGSFHWDSDDGEVAQPAKDAGDAATVGAQESVPKERMYIDLDAGDKEDGEIELDY